MKQPLLAAHRGGGDGKYPENSLAAMRSALKLGVDIIEFDVRETRDGAWIVRHDATVIIDGDERPIAELTVTEVLGSDTNIPRLEEVLQLVKGHVLAHVDIKDAGSEVAIADACAEVLGPDGFIVTTLEDAGVGRLRTERPHYRTGLALGRLMVGHSLAETLRVRWSELRPWRRIEACGADFIIVHHLLAKLNVLRGAYRRHIPVLVWTLNTKELIQAAQNDPRVWAYTTDYPRLAIEQSTHSKLARTSA